jgi:hypothetical protein
MMRKLAAIISTAALIVGLFAMTSFGGGKPKEDPICEYICVPMPPPIYVHCMIYCPPIM